MTPSEPTPGDERPGDSPLAFSIMFFAVALLTLMLGWAEGVRRDSTFLHIPETRSCLIIAAVLIIIGVVLMLWSRRGRGAS